MPSEIFRRREPARALPVLVPLSILLATGLLFGCANPAPESSPPTALAATMPMMAASAASAADRASGAGAAPLADTPPAPVRAVRNPATSDPVPMLLAYAERVRSLQAPELAMEITRLNDSATAADDPVGQIELALALLQTRLPPDTARATALLQKAMGSNSTVGLQAAPLARLLTARALEQRRLEDLVDRQNQQARDAQKRIDQLNERLEAVRAIERSINSRPAAGAGAPQAANAGAAGNPSGAAATRGAEAR